MTEDRPYANVVRKGSRRWAAYQPVGDRHKYLGSFGSPEQARRTVLIAQASNLEARAARYRAEAEALS